MLQNFPPPCLFFWSFILFIGLNLFVGGFRLPHRIATNTETKFQIKYDLQEMYFATLIY